MRSNPTRSAFIIIDMENGFISPESAHCIAGARATVPACGRALEAARSTAELLAIESGESVEVVQTEPTPEPTPEPTMSPDAQPVAVDTPMTVYSPPESSQWSPSWVTFSRP